jgi:hypothetical protein
MTAQHMKMQRPELDVALTDGQGYVVEDATYRQHLQDAVEIKQVGPIVVDFVHTIHSAIEINMQKSQSP